MKILVTGSKGQMGNDFQSIAAEYPGFSFLFTDIEELDITDQHAIRNYLHLHQPDAVVNCAAYTAVDKAESEPEKAMLINSEAPGWLSDAASGIRALFIHISTDYIYGGKSYRPYVEEDPASPVSVYAKSKYDGESAVQKHASRAVIIRTSWLYSSFGHNFVKTIRKYATERDELRVVFDQVGTPTWSRDLCHAILRIIPKIQDLSGVEVYHYSNEGVCSWYDFARAIVDLSGISCRITPIETVEYPLPATRPFYSVLNKNKIKRRFHMTIPDWRDSLEECLKLM